MLPSLADLRDHVLATPPRGITRIVTVDGRSGSGKTHLAARLAPLLDARLVHVDELVPGWHALEQGLTTTAAELVAPLLAGRTATPTTWDWVASAPGPRLEVAPGGTVVVEGSGATVLRALGHVDTAILVTVPEDVRLARLDAREDRDGYLPWRETWARQELALARTHRTDLLADLVVGDVPDAVGRTHHLMETR